MGNFLKPDFLTHFKKTCCREIDRFNESDQIGELENFFVKQEKNAAEIIV